jgi:hypothetical protein
VFGSPPVQHAEAERTGIDPDDIAVAKVLKTLSEPNRDPKPVCIIRIRRSLKEYRSLESSRPGRQ